jgi:hypothetical protein
MSPMNRYILVSVQQRAAARLVETPVGRETLVSGGTPALSDVHSTNACCASHSSWTELVEHLIAGFPTITPAEVVDIVSRARSAEEAFGLAEGDQLATAEIIARHQLLQITSGAPTPRLDPERHVRGRRTEPDPI